MQEIKFSYKHEYLGVERQVSASTNADSLDTIVECFEDFLRGSGFVFDGHLDIVDEE